LYKIFAAEFIGCDKESVVESVKQVALRFFKDYLKSDCFKRVPGFNRVYKWSDLLQYNRDNFLFVAKWHLSQLKIIEAAKTSYNKRVTQGPKRAHAKRTS